jgi:hypothetical protein
MTIKASGRAALVLAAGLWICAAVPSQAADDADSAATPVVKHSLQHPKNYADDKSSKKAEKPSGSNKTADAVHSSDGSALHSSRLPPSVANANAELTTETQASKDAKAMSERANNIVQAAADNTVAAQPAPGGTVVAPDQLNDVDRALAAPAAPPEAAAPVPVDGQQAPPATSAHPVIIAASSGNSTWDQTSLIGKVFIGFGALLTLASAARMFIA